METNRVKRRSEHVEPDLVAPGILLRMHITITLPSLEPDYIHLKTLRPFIGSSSCVRVPRVDYHPASKVHLVLQAREVLVPAVIDGCGYGVERSETRAGRILEASEYIEA